jgi:hypothetical protein
MIMDTNSVLLIAGICIVIGFLIGGMISSLRREPESSSLDDYEGALLKVRLSTSEDNLIIELNGNEYERSSNLTTIQRNQLNKIILDLNAWLAYGPPKAQEKIDMATAVPEQQDIDDSEKPKPRINLSPVNVLTNAFKADVQLSQLPTESIVSQIDDILQDKLRESPLSGEPIRLMEWPQKGMVVMVGLEQYDSVDEVPNEEIKKLIRAAVSEWEERSLDSA